MIRLAVVLLALPTSAAAMCIEKPRFDWQGKIAARIDLLDCEQSELMDLVIEMTRKIQQDGAERALLALRIEALERQLDIILKDQQ